TSTLSFGVSSVTGGTFTYQASGNTLKGTVASGAAVTLQSSDANGAATVAWTTSGFTNAGQITMTSAGTAARNTSLNVAVGNTLANSGQLDLAAGVGGTRFVNADTFTNGGTTNVNAKTTIDRTVGSSGALVFTNTGHVNIASGSTLTINS